MGKNLSASSGDTGSIPGGEDPLDLLGGYPGGGYGSPLRDSCLGNPMDRGAQRATVHGVAKSRT